MQPTSIKKGTGNYGEWKSTLSFYKDELVIFKNRLTEIVQKNNGKEIMQQVEHFENQFLVQSEKIDILQHDINVHLNTMAQDVQQHAGHISTAALAEDSKLREQFESESRIYEALKTEFMQFLSKVM